jgi:hypothetical protein
MLQLGRPFTVTVWLQVVLQPPAVRGRLMVTVRVKAPGAPEATWTEGPVLDPTMDPLPVMVQRKVFPVPSVWAV